jgi:hypothetical protein
MKTFGHQKKADRDRERFFNLARRMITLGSLLPSDDIDLAAALEDPDERADAVMIVNEMQKVRVEIDAEIAAHRERKRRPRPRP